jgi:FKBP-type peptidyl-prolyl cis-trans isomerase SlpA
VSTAPKQIEQGRHVRLHLSIHLADGTEVLSSFGGEPLDCRIGDGTLAAGLEDLLLDLPAGSDTQFIADGAAVYGPHDPALIHVLARDDLPPDFTPDPGQVISFQTPGGQETAGTILGEDETGVRVDFNHPLSSRGLRLRALVLSVD